MTMRAALIALALLELWALWILMVQR